MSHRRRRNQRNYYRILFVQPEAPQAIIQASYRTIMQKLKAHPDLGGDEWNAAVINEAFSVLNDPARRAAYDRNLLKGKSRKSLSIQTPAQRARAERGLDQTWEDFRPIRV